MAHHIKKAKKWLLRKSLWGQIGVGLLAAFLLISGIMVIWVATLRIPDIETFENRVLAGSTKIYDRTGEILLFDLNQDVKRQIVPFDKISPNVKNATVAIEDDTFYEHKGIAFISILRAVWVDLIHLELKQGGSTITQQVIKNSLLTADKKISRKIKEWVLALKLERVMSKDDILHLYLNTNSYGGTYYGIEEASQNYFDKHASELTIAEGAYMAAIPKAPSYYSPYGNHRTELDARKNLVLQIMLDKNVITKSEYDAAKAEKVIFQPAENHSIKAPHFVMFIKDYLTEKYGEDMVKNGSLNVVTTLDYTMQKKAEEIVKEYALKNEKNFNAENAALVAVDPATGQILTMVGSRDYFDPDIDGNYNVTIAKRQPGSAFKPFAYVTAFNKGYTPDTVVFDLPTQFSTACDPYGKPLNANTSPESCYAPRNYDNDFRGPMTLRNALAQSINIPAIKTLYLAGLKDTLQTARDLGITTLTDSSRYGLTLVLGGGEVSPLEITGAYSVFANNGVRNPNTAILKITNQRGDVVEEFTPSPTQIIPEQSVLTLNNILSDNNARMPLNGPGSPTDFPNREIALKTGTTNDSRDAWIIGYTPQIAVGAWAGNNDNSAMVKKTSGLIIAPLWRAFMNEVLKDLPAQEFKRPDPIDPSLRPILRGIWQGGQTYTIDKASGKLATDFTPPELREERAIPNIHAILYWVNRADPKGPPPTDPTSDSQFLLWETPVQAWIQVHPELSGQSLPPSQTDDVHTPDSIPRINITSPAQNSLLGKNDKILVSFDHPSKFPIVRAEFYVNDSLVGTETNEPFSFSFIPNDVPNLKSTNELRIVIYDSVQNKAEAKIQFLVRS